jgi:hypothetical protein
MKMRLMALVGLIFCVGLAMAAPSIATISSRGSVTVSGVAVPAGQMISWPVAASDEIVTKAEPAIVKFKDGSSMLVQRNSRVKLEPANNNKFSLLAGSVIYQPKANVAEAPVLKGRRAAEASALASRAPLYETERAGALPPPMKTAMYRNPGSGAQYFVAPESIGVGSFPKLGGISVKASDTSVPTSPEIDLPTGGKILLSISQQQSGPVYTVTQILVPIDVPGQSNPVLVPFPSNNALIGQMLSPAGGAGQTGFAGGWVATGSLTQAQLVQLYETGASQALQTAIQNGTVPAGSTIQQSPVRLPTVSPE